MRGQLVGDGWNRSTDQSPGVEPGEQLDQTAFLLFLLRHSGRHRTYQRVQHATHGGHVFGSIVLLEIKKRRRNITRAFSCGEEISLRPGYVGSLRATVFKGRKTYFSSTEPTGKGKHRYAALF